MSIYTRRAYIVYSLIMMWLICIPALVVFSLGVSITMLENPLTTFAEAAESTDIDVAWSWSTIKKGWQK